MKVFRTPGHDPKKKAPEAGPPAAEVQQDALGNAARAEALPEQEEESSLLDSVAAGMEQEQEEATRSFGLAEPRGARRFRPKTKAKPQVREEPAVVELESAKEGKGTATLATSSGLDDVARDQGSYTSVFLDMKKAHPDKSDDELLDMMARKEVNPGSQTAHLGERSEGAEGKKQALIIGNEDYAELLDLSGAKADATAMASTYKGEGFEVDHQADLGGKDLGSAIQSAGSGLKEGDELLVYYAGHGKREGLLGVDHPDKGSVVSDKSVAAKVSEAQGGGYHATVMIDACHAGGSIDELQEGQGETQAPEEAQKEDKQASP